MRTLLKLITVAILVSIVFIGGQSYLENTTSSESEKLIKQTRHKNKNFQEMTANTSSFSPNFSTTHQQQNTANTKDISKQNIKEHFDNRQNHNKLPKENTDNKMKYHWKNKDNNLGNS